MTSAAVSNDEATITGHRRTSASLRTTIATFLRFPSPWMLTTMLTGAVVGRVLVGGWAWTDALVPAIMVAVFPFVEWGIHVGILHWKPRRVAGVKIDSLLASKHRAHHRDPRDLPLVFIPWQVLCWLIPLDVAIALFAFPQRHLGLTFLVTLGVLALGYEWTHFLIHSDYKPKTRMYKAVWRNHRLHHFKNEHFWMTVTTSGTADRVFGTYPDPATVRTSPTAKNLHSLS